MEEIKECPLGNATDLLTWFNFPYNLDVKSFCFPKAVFHALVLAKKNFQPGSKSSVYSVTHWIFKGQKPWLIGKCIGLWCKRGHQRDSWSRGQPVGQTIYGCQECSQAIMY